MLVTGSVGYFGDLINQAEANAIKGILEGKLETEPSITDRFVQGVEDIVNESGVFEGIRFHARTLRDRGPNAPEHEFGADLCGVLRVDLPKFQQSKGFLIQAKIVQANLISQGPRGFTGVRFPDDDEFKRLQSQAEHMLEITPDSFILIYSSKGFFAVPASDILALKDEGTTYGKPVAAFFKEFLMCFIGDTRISAWDDSTLRSVKEKTNSRRVLLISLEKSQ